MWPCFDKFIVEYLTHDAGPISLRPGKKKKKNTTNDNKIMTLMRLFHPALLWISEAPVMESIKMAVFVSAC